MFEIFIPEYIVHAELKKIFLFFLKKPLTNYCRCAIIDTVERRKGTFILKWFFNFCECVICRDFFTGVLYPDENFL